MEGPKYELIVAAVGGDEEAIDDERSQKYRGHFDSSEEKTFLLGLPMHQSANRGNSW